MGASNHVPEERQSEDYYATDPKAAELLLEVEPDLNNIWECACGEGHLASVFEEKGKLSAATDLIDRGYRTLSTNDCYGEDFLKKENYYLWCGDIVTNPPYKYAKEFVEKALKLVPTGRKVCMFLKLTFLEGKTRKEFFKKNPPKTIYVCSGRIPCAKNGEFEIFNEKTQKLEPVASAVAYAWYVWEKGYKGDTVVKWIN